MWVQVLAVGVQKISVVRQKMQEMPDVTLDMK